MADGRVFATGRARPGRSLADVLAAQGPLAPARRSALVDQVTSALEALEASGVHGLLPTPSSVLVTVDGGSEHVYLAPLETGTDEATPAALAAERLHETMRVAQSSGAAGARGASAPARPRRRLRASAAPRRAGRRRRRRGDAPARLARLGRCAVATAPRVGERPGGEARGADPARSRARRRRERRVRRRIGLGRHRQGDPAADRSPHEPRRRGADPGTARPASSST